MVALLLLAAAAVTVAVLLLRFVDVKKWFKQNEITDRDAVNVVLKEKLAGGKFKTVGGIFNTKTNQILKVNAWESEKIDSTLEEMERVSVLREL